MKQIKQFRYYGQTSENNYPTLSNFYGTLKKGNLFASHGGITHLGIQGLPGTKFYLNNSVESIIIGSTGRLEINTIDMKHLERSAKLLTRPKGRSAVTTDTSRIYIKEVDGNEMLIGVMTHKNVKTFSPMFDKFGFQKN